MSTPGRIEVARQPDGTWRWRWLPDDFSVEPLVASHGFDDRESAEESAREAYPTSPVVTVGDTLHGVRRSGHRAFWWALTGVAIVVTTIVMARQAVDRANNRTLTVTVTPTTQRPTPTR
ncbi:hypothetical protein [Nocardioides terrisoli]|uniref:hypothetical protein n=1 Tax=Nocardioides terrisoli TaxID=3388267 RepID=UPI00287B8354|nr:hypothetical protein [Nocardioides marmorisolisilvae]